MCVYLIRFEACEAEHPDLVDDMLPVVSGALLLQTGNQLFSHLNDAVSHTVDLLQPGINDSRSNRSRNGFWNSLVQMKDGHLKVLLQKSKPHIGVQVMCVCVCVCINQHIPQ